MGEMYGPSLEDELLAKAKVDLGSAIRDLADSAVEPITKDYFEELLKTWPGD